MKTKIKICGIREKETVDVCRELSVDYLGFNFSPISPRNISPKNIEKLIVDRLSPNFPKVVFLFYGNDLSLIYSLIKEFKPDYVQLVAGDPVDITDVWLEYLNSKILLPAFRLQGKVGDESLLCPELPFVILDSYQKEMGGGTGHTFPWEYVKDVKRPYLLAGGITADNVEEAIRYLHPYGIDVASGVETNGSKDSEKIRNLVKNVHGS
ncbi:MAG: phosphoribosylanthranilate isomerase [Leptospira sp.]|nr:phosphoribosylanthranilate isomerase [Leptospira sp.]